MLKRFLAKNYFIEDKGVRELYGEVVHENNDRSIQRYL